MIIMEDESIGCSNFSVDQNNSNKTEIVMSRHSLAEIGPSSFNCFLTNSVPPSISFSSG